MFVLEFLLLIQIDSGIGMLEFKTRLLSFTMLPWVSYITY